jgi:hypothetical protein
MARLHRSGDRGLSGRCVWRARRASGELAAARGRVHPSTSATARGALPLHAGARPSPRPAESRRIGWPTSPAGPCHVALHGASRLAIGRRDRPASVEAAKPPGSAAERRRGRHRRRERASAVAGPASMRRRAGVRGCPIRRPAAAWPAAPTGRRSTARTWGGFGSHPAPYPSDRPAHRQTSKAGELRQMPERHRRARRLRTKTCDRRPPWPIVPVRMDSISGAPRGGR